jgi:hypothetical protein
LRFVVLKNGEVGAGEAADGLAFVIGDEHVEDRFTGIYLDGGNGGRCRLAVGTGKAEFCGVLCVKERGECESEEDDRFGEAHEGFSWLRGLKQILRRNDKALRAVVDAARKDKDDSLRESRPRE